MIKLLNTLYILSDDVYLKLDGENVVATKNEEIVGRYPLHTLQNIVVFSYKGASPALMGKCASDSVQISFFTPNGKYLASAVGEINGNILLRKEQYRIADNENKSLQYAKNMILGKVFNERWCIERTKRDHMLRLDVDKITQTSNYLFDALTKIRSAQNMDSLRGIEGKTAESYFSIFNELIINQKDSFSFTERTRRPPKDAINALISFVYVLMSNECASALEGVGLDAYAGFMHSDRPGRYSLALDLMEEFRSSICDRFILTMINMKIIKPIHFTKQDSAGAVFLNDDGRKLILSEWQNHKRESITHPYLKEKIEWGLVPHVQAMLLARTIRGDLEEYPPFLWK